MNDRAKLLLSSLRKHPVKRPPFWFMRQAGRYLPEYLQLRSKAKNFLEFCYCPAMASEATLQPIRRFEMDAAIIFSDILVVPHALGVDVRFEEGKGPLLSPVQTGKDLDRLGADRFVDRLAPVYEALRLTRKALPEETALIGFAGAPWTLASYMIEGKGSRDFQNARSMIYQEPAFFGKLMDLLTESVSQHAIAQIKAGADVIQVFDSWAGVLSEPQFTRWSIEPMRRIVSAIKAVFPDVPVIGFPRMAGAKMRDYAVSTGVDAISVDGSVSLSWVKETLQSVCVVQGNLDPVVLKHDRTGMLEEASRILSTLGHKPFVFNLGHGILPATPVEHVQALCRAIREFSTGA